MAHDVFISYSAKDKTTADGVCATLEAKGIRCWIAPRDILPGMDWGEAIIEAINGSRVIVLVF
jgi:TIR domain